jgi:cellulose synthase/poly-beta-1,6-N-acetylglucosamine synthase-like glycosyltransferase
MILIFSVVSLSILAIAVLCQAFWAWRFASLVAQPPAQPIQDDQLPRVAVVLCLRGADPSLIGCLNGLLRQNYPLYDVHVVVDNRHDPAWEIVHRAIRQTGAKNVRIRILDSEWAACSLKLSGLVQAIGAFDDPYDVVALIDADVTPYADWLRDLVAPFQNPKVGATTGIRWYVANKANWGTTVRYLWDAAACSQMYAFQIPWGGSLALRAELFTHGGLLEQWKRSLWEDTAVYQTCKENGLELRFVPAATMVNRETTDLKSCFQFIRRQMLNVRLYHPSWRVIVAHAIASSMGLAAAAVLWAVSAFNGEWKTSVCLGGGLVASAGGMAFALSLLQSHVRRLVKRRGERTPRLEWRTILGVPLAQVVYLACLASAALLRRVQWRGITYEFHGPWQVRMLRYQRYRPGRKAVAQGASVI